MNNLLILLSMIFLHIVDDYYLQGVLASMKQKDWWKKNAPDEMYKYDYLVALFMHSFSWAFVMMLPLIFVGEFIIWVFIGNVVIHFITDHLKANLKEINLIWDQMIHIEQIVVSWLICVILI